MWSEGRKERGEQAGRQTERNKALRGILEFQEPHNSTNSLLDEEGGKVGGAID